jgi:hypothetical protein
MKHETANQLKSGDIPLVGYLMLDGCYHPLNTYHVLSKREFWAHGSVQPAHERAQALSRSVVNAETTSRHSSRPLVTGGPKFKNHRSVTGNVLSRDETL